MSQRDKTAEQKAKAVIELLQGERILAEIASSEGVTPGTLDNWRKEFLANAARTFTISKDEKEAARIREAAEERERALAEKVGQLTVELDWLKKKSAQAGMPGEKGNGRYRR